MPRELQFNSKKPEIPNYELQSEVNIRSQMIIEKNQRHAQIGQKSPFFNLNYQLDLCEDMKQYAVTVSYLDAVRTRAGHVVSMTTVCSKREQKKNNLLTTYFSCFSG